MRDDIIIHGLPEESKETYQILSSSVIYERQHEDVTESSQSPTD